MKTLKKCIITGLLSLSCTYAYADLVVIVDTESSVESMSRSELGRIFLGKSTEFSSGGDALPVNQIMVSSIRTEFDSTMLKRSESQMKGYWSRQLFSGEGTPPEEVNGDIDVLRRVINDPSAIGYIDTAALNDAVKVVSITE